VKSGEGGKLLLSSWFSEEDSGNEGIQEQEQQKRLIFPLEAFHPRAENKCNNNNSSSLCVYGTFKAE
jgi:hypothetical protein